MARIVTHTDFDGVASALLVRAATQVEDIVFEEPWRLQQGIFKARKGDIILDLPYAEGCALWFDHHETSSEWKEKGVLEPDAPSCARVVFTHFLPAHPDLERFASLVDAADKIDTASFTREDIAHPDTYGKLSMAIRGDDRKRDDEFRRFLIEMLLFQPAEKVLEQPIIRKRVEEKMRQHEAWHKSIPQYVRIIGTVIFVDRTLAPEDLPYGQRFQLYLMYPGKAIYLSADNMKTEPDKVRISAGENIFEPLNKADLGELMRAYGGGGHKAAAGCSIPRSKKDEIVTALVNEINRINSA